MTFDEWRKLFPCPTRKGYSEHVVDCLHCSCAFEAWEQQDANYAPLVEACRAMERLIDEIYANTQSGTLGMSREEQKEKLTRVLGAVGDALKLVTPVTFHK